MNAPAHPGRTLSRDYKHVKRHATTRGGEPFGGWVGFGAGLALGLGVALLVFLHYRGQPESAPQQAQAEAAPQSDVATADEMVAGPPAGDVPGGDLTFYDMLKKQEVEVPPDPESRSRAGSRAAGGSALLQAGAFKQAGEAEKRVAQLATLGITARVKRFAMDDETWYRVQIGPIETAQEYEQIKDKLADAEIEATTVSSPEPAAPP